MIYQREKKKKVCCCIGQSKQAMDCSGWKCWILLHVLISLPAIGLMCCCRSAMTESTQISDSPKPIGTCDGRCGQFNRSESCQCNKQCVKSKFKDCCNDYRVLCDATCEGRCDKGYEQHLHCQCNDKCQDNDNCCEDHEEICLHEDTQPAHVCYITTYVDSEDELLSNDTVWTCVTNGVTSLHRSRDCKFPIDSMDKVVNLTRGVTTKIDCSLVSTKPPIPYTYEWRMDAPIQSKIILRVHHADEENNMTVIDVDDSNNTHIFSANESFDNGNDFVSSSNTVIMAATFSDSAQSQNFIVIGRTREDAGSDNVMISIVLVPSSILLIIGATLGVIWYKRRHSSLKPKGRRQRQSLDDRVIDSSIKTGTGDQKRLEDSTDLVQRSPRNATLIAPSRAVQLQGNARTGLRVSGSSTGENMVIYNEVGEENYNVLFGGKEQGDYHTYSLPDSANRMQMTSKEREGNLGNSCPVEQSEHDESRNGSTIANHTYERKITPTEQAHASRHVPMNATTQSKQEPDYETPESKPKTTSDYEHPFKDLGAVHKPYDHLRHKTASGVPKQTTAVAVDIRTSHGAEENAVNNYQALDNCQEKNESGEYSNLQRPLDIKPSPDHPLILSSSNEYGELGGNI